MSCVSITNLLDADNCGANPGGLVALYVIRKQDAVSIPDADATNTITDAITLVTGKKWAKWEFEQDSASIEEKGTGDSSSQSFSVEIPFNISGSTPAIDTILSGAINGKFLVITEDNLGQMRLFGNEKRALKLDQEYTTGLKPTDKNQHKNKFSGDGFRHKGYFYDGPALVTF